MNTRKIVALTVAFCIYLSAFAQINKSINITQNEIR